MSSPPSQLTQSRVRSAWIFLAPMLVILAIVAGYPLLRTIWLGFTDARLDDLSGAEWVGFKNYFYVRSSGKSAGVLADSDWWRSVWNTFSFSFISVFLETALGLAVALVLNASFRMRGLVRTAVLIPWAIPTVVSAKMWGWILNDQFGFLNYWLQTFGLIDGNVAWIASPEWSMFSVIMVDVWKTTPFMALLILAALQMLPTSCYEAAKIDGIHPVKVFFKVTLPLIWPAVMVAVIFRLLDALRIFDLIYVLTANSKDTMTMSVYVNQYTMDFQKVGQGSAAATLLFFIIALLTILYIVIGRVRFD